MEWILQHLPVFVIVFMILSFVRTIVKAAKRAQEQQRKTAEAVPRGGDPEAEERTRRIQAEIRRKIAERRGEIPARGASAQTVPTRPPEQVSPLERKRTPELDPFGGPMGRVLKKLEEAARQAQAAEEPPQLPREEEPRPSVAAVLERQQKLAEQMRDLEEARRREQRRAAEIGNETASMAPTPGAALGARGDLLDDLRGAKALRRAIVLREVLGPPVALR
jgi:hypothetical protein